MTGTATQEASCGDPHLVDEYERHDEREAESGQQVGLGGAAAHGEYSERENPEHCESQDGRGELRGEIRPPHR